MQTSLFTTICIARLSRPRPLALYPVHNPSFAICAGTGPGSTGNMHEADR